MTMPEVTVVDCLPAGGMRTSCCGDWLPTKTLPPESTASENAEPIPAYEAITCFAAS
jgi:hypothetical protein